MKPLVVTEKQSNRGQRQRKVLLALVEHHIKTGKPVGSATLKEVGFPNLSSATIRNYFTCLEEDGYLRQQHSSAGRIPTDRAYRVYAEELMQHRIPAYLGSMEPINGEETREIAHYLQKVAEWLSEQTKSAVFLSAPRFDHDFVVAIKLVRVSSQKLVCLLITEFGEIQTIVLHTDLKLSSFSVKRVEDYCQWRLNGLQKPDNLEKEEETLAQSLYNEAMLRYIVRYSHFIDEEIYRTGFSKLLLYPEFRDPHLLGNSLALFENAHSMRLLLRECSSTNQLKFWIGDDLLTYSQQPPHCSVIATPYSVNQQPVGAIGILGPMRMPYRDLFGILGRLSEEVSDMLTRSLYKFKIKYRQPEQQMLYLPKQEQQRVLGQKE